VPGIFLKASCPKTKRIILREGVPEEKVFLQAGASFGAI
jgi:hypothetical protein